MDNADNWEDIVTTEIKLDNEDPTVPTLVSPGHEVYMTQTNPWLLWNPSNDGDGSGLSGYYYQLSTVSNFNTLVADGHTTST